MFFFDSFLIKTEKEGKETVHPAEVSFISSLQNCGKLIGNTVTDNFTSYEKYLSEIGI